MLISLIHFRFDGQIINLVMGIFNMFFYILMILNRFIKNNNFAICGGSFPILTSDWTISRLAKNQNMSELRTGRIQMAIDVIST